MRRERMWGERDEVRREGMCGRGGKEDLRREEGRRERGGKERERGGKEERFHENL